MAYRVEGVIFDQDGLMFDTERPVAKGWEVAGKEFGYDVNEEFLATVRGRSVAEIKEMFAARYGKDAPFDAMNLRKRAYCYELLDREGTPVKKGLKQLLAYLKSRSLPMAVATSSSREWTERNLKDSGTQNYFDVLVYGDMVARSKPSPDIFLLAAKKLGVAPERCIVLEDSIQGNRAAIAGGFLSVMVPDLTLPDSELAGKLTACCDSLLDVVKLFEEGFFVCENR